MAKQARNQKTGQPGVRKGEGTPVRIQLISAPGAPAGTQGINIDLSTAPVPERKYYADICNVVTKGKSLKVMFGQLQIGSNKLRSLVIVKQTISGASFVLTSLDSMKNPSFEEMSSALGLDPEISPPIQEEPVQVVELGAKFALCALSGYDACIDFFEASPFAMSHALKTNILFLDAVVRVNLSTALLIGMVRELRGAVIAAQK